MLNKNKNNVVNKINREIRMFSDFKLKELRSENDEEKQDYPIDIIIVSIGSNSGWCECGSWCFGIGLADHAAADFRMQRRR